MITVLTPTYNRKNTIEKAYESLINQTNKNFEWMIVDDGSSDNTKELINKFIKKKKITIKYFYKENGGKHTALNYGINKIKSKFTIILDSDDYLLPNAIELIENNWKKYDNKKDIACLSFIKVFPNNQTIGKKYEGTEIISNHIDFRYNKNLLGDMCEVFKTSVLKEYPFPVYNNERFLSEAIVWNKIALKYNTVYINEPIYVAEYLGEGLSNNFFKLVSKNPIGASENSNMFLIKNFNLKIRIKNAILYNGYCFKANKKIKEIISNSNNKFLTILFMPAGFIFYLLLKYKFK
jgi:glycosyltransferase involved in cell wall biosynthesis